MELKKIVWHQKNIVNETPAERKMWCISEMQRKVAFELGTRWRCAVVVVVVELRISSGRCTTRSRRIVLNSSQFIQNQRNIVTRWIISYLNSVPESDLYDIQHSPQHMIWDNPLTGERTVSRVIDLSVYFIPHICEKATWRHL